MFLGHVSKYFVNFTNEYRKVHFKKETIEANNFSLKKGKSMQYRSIPVKVSYISNYNLKIIKIVLDNHTDKFPLKKPKRLQCD